MLIALIGIVNTLMLSVFERTREIGLLRAVGMRRRQVRAMIRSEAVILAMFGAVIGIVVGTGLGIALVSSLKQQGITDTVVPVAAWWCSWCSPPCSAWSRPAGPPAGRPGSTCSRPSPRSDRSGVRWAVRSDRVRARRTPPGAATDGCEPPFPGVPTA